MKDNKYSSWTFHFRLYHRNKERILSTQNQRYISVMLPDDTPLDIALEEARKNGAPIGSHITGIYEVHNDQGIYQQINLRKIVPSRKHLYTFKTWDELEKAERDTESFKDWAE